MNEKELQAIDKVVEYLFDNERKSYILSTEEEQKNHIYHQIMILNDILLKHNWGR